MGYVITRVIGTGKVRHTAIYRDIKGRLRSAGTFSSEKLATKAWQKAEADVASGRVADPRKGRQTLRQYVVDAWFPNHVIEATTREHYSYLLDRYVLPELGGMRMAEILPGHVREWITRLQSVHGARPPTIRKCKVILDAILTTALNDQITFLHAGKGVKTPPVATKPRRIITAEQFERIYAALGDDTVRLLVETDIESGLRWGELTELRAKDLDIEHGVITVSRVVVHLRSNGGARFLVKDYPKDKQWRQVRLSDHLVSKLANHIAERGLGKDDLLFTLPRPSSPRRRRLPDVLPDPQTLGLTAPNANGHRYHHGTITAYSVGGCRCQHCRNAIAAYRAARRSMGKDEPRSPRTVNTDGHISNDWFRANVWREATADLGFHATPHDLRHAHASWLLAGGADIQVVKERLGHGSIVTTEKYLRALPNAQDAALEALAAIRGVKPKVDATDVRDAHGKTDIAELTEVLAKFQELYETLSNKKTT
jgi:integrase